LRQILLKPSNAGQRQYQGEIVGKADWEPLVSLEDWQSLVARLKNPERLRGTPRGPAARYLLSNIARCGECGSRVKGSTSTARMPLAYTCRECHKVTASGPRVDEVVHAVVVAVLAREDVVRELGSRFRAAEDQEAAEEEGGTAASARRQLEEQRALLMEQVVAGKMSAVMAGGIEERFMKKVEDAEARERAAILDPTVREFVEADDLVTAWANAELPEQRALLRALFQVTINRATTRGRKFDPQRVTVEWLR
jgi:site-specific DNA recombinase